MGSIDLELGQTIARHEREISDLHRQVQALQDGYAKEQLQAQITKSISELEAEIKLQELQETVAKEEAEKRRPRRFFRLRRSD